MREVRRNLEVHKKFPQRTKYYGMLRKEFIPLNTQTRNTGRSQTH
jgi:hypothetical protein